MPTARASVAVSVSQFVPMNVLSFTNPQSGAPQLVQIQGRARPHASFLGPHATMVLCCSIAILNCRMTLIPRSTDCPRRHHCQPRYETRQPVPPGQSRTRKWPVLDASGPPESIRVSGGFKSGGLVQSRCDGTLDEFPPPSHQGVRRFPLRHALVAPGQYLGRCFHTDLGGSAGGV